MTGCREDKQAYKSKTTRTPAKANRIVFKNTAPEIFLKRSQHAMRCFVEDIIP
jgi:hypothetical protein